MKGPYIHTLFPTSPGALSVNDWVLLIPPSESKADAPAKGACFEASCTDRKLNAFRDLNPARKKVFDSLAQVLKRGIGLEQIFEVSSEALDQAISVNRKLSESFVQPARSLYNGIMFESISYDTLKPAEKKCFDSKVLILSGLFGILRPCDQIPPYKLKMSANLGGAVGKLCQFWRRPVSEILRREVRGKVVWDFLPDLHQRVWDNSGEIAARHQVKFVKRVVRSGVAEYKTISHHSKSLKGALIRHLLRKNAKEPDDLSDFEHPDGYFFNGDLSVVNRQGSMLVFSAD
ncbi:YaaA family protein [soil metagenome]